MPPLRLSALGVLLAACPPAAEPEPAPDVPGCISLEPPELAFPDVDLTADGEHWTALDLEIRNDCDGDLIVHSMTVDGHGVYLSGFLGGSVAARSSALTTVTFEPKQPGEIARSIAIITDAPDNTRLWMTAAGTALGPRVSLDTSWVRMTGTIGCPQRQAVRLWNVGNTDLVVHDFALVDSTSAELSLDLDPSMNGALPFTLGPYDRDVEGPHLDVYVDYLPLDITRDTATLRLSSNDPALPLADRDVRGDGVRYQQVVDDFEPGAGRTYPLTRLPVVETLAVQRGADVVTSGWTYAAEGNEVVFDTPPADHERVTLTYERLPDCED